MKMKGKKLVLTVLDKVVGAEVKRNKDGKGPFCTGWFYQPKRPNTKK